jgi:uncharacterized protein (DUF169 family)
MEKDVVEAFGLLELERAPVAFKFSLEKPSGLKRLDEKVIACGMIKKAREVGPFYSDNDGQACIAGRFVLGFGDAPHAFECGAYGAALKICKTPKAMQRMYRSLPMIEKGHASYVCAAPLDKAEFEPDVVVVTCNTTWKAFNLLRAYSYDSGKTWKGESTPGLGCAWMFSYPYITGEANVVIPSAGMFNPYNNAIDRDELIIAIPLEQLYGIVRNLKEMPMVLPAHAPGGDEWKRKLRKELGIEG